MIIKYFLKGFVSLYIIIIFSHILSASVESDIQYIKNNMLTRAEFELYVRSADKRFEDINKRFEDVNKRFDFLQSLLIIMLATLIGTTIYSVLSRAKDIEKLSDYKQVLDSIQEWKELKNLIKQVSEKNKEFKKIFKAASFL